jgi:GNAT superfamily N-acetyltransferase
VSVALRLATSDDWPALWPVFRAVVAAGDSYTYDPTTAYDAGQLTWLAPAPAETWLAEEAGEVLGTYRLGPNQPGLGDHVANGSYMTAAAARGRGVGRLLGEHSLERARERGFTAMQFNAVVASNEVAVRLWTSLGFATVGRVPGAFRHPALGPVDLLVMHRSL